MPLGCPGMRENKTKRYCPLSRGIIKQQKKNGQKPHGVRYIFMFLDTLLLFPPSFYFLDGVNPLQTPHPHAQPPDPKGGCWAFLDRSKNIILPHLLLHVTHRLCKHISVYRSAFRKQIYRRIQALRFKKRDPEILKEWLVCSNEKKTINIFGSTRSFFRVRHGFSYAKSLSLEERK
jgi:hypothetical protein